jgi:hypothetical protein
MNREQRLKSHIALAKQIGLNPHLFMDYIEHVVDTICLIVDNQNKSQFLIGELMREKTDLLNRITMVTDLTRTAQREGMSGLTSSELVGILEGKIKEHPWR